MLNCDFNKVAIRPKLCGSCAFSQNFHTRKLGKITVFFAVPGYINPVLRGRFCLERTVIIVGHYMNHLPQELREFFLVLTFLYSD